MSAPYDPLQDVASDGFVDLNKAAALEVKAVGWWAEPQSYWPEWTGALIVLAALATLWFRLGWSGASAPVLPLDTVPAIAVNGQPITGTSTCKNEVLK